MILLGSTDCKQGQGPCNILSDICSSDRGYRTVSEEVSERQEGSQEVFLEEVPCSTPWKPGGG